MSKKMNRLKRPSIQKTRRHSSRIILSKPENRSIRVNVYQKIQETSHTTSRKSFVKKNHNAIKLRLELQDCWQNSNVSQSHTALFLARYQGKPEHKICSIYQNEIYAIQTGSAPILLVQQAVQVRERLFQAWKNLIQQNPSKSQIEDLIKKIKTSSKEVFETIQHWKKSLKQEEAVFMHNKQNYIEKMLDDNKAISDYQKKLKKSTKKSTELPHLQTQETEKKIVKFKTYNLSHPNRKRVVSKSSSRPKLCKIPSVLQLTAMKAQAKKVCKEEAIYSQSYILRLISEQMSYEVVHESVTEIEQASMQLFAHHLFTHYANKTVQALSYIVTRECLEQTMNKIIFEIGDMLVNEIMEQDFRGLVQLAKNQIVQDWIIQDLVYELKFEIMIDNCISQQKYLNQKMVTELWEIVIKDTFEDEWFEILVEEELGKAGLDKIWDIMPPLEQHKI